MSSKAPVKLGPTNNPGGARWCTEHEGVIGGRLECTKNRSKGRGPCHAPAIRGLDACKTHVGLKKDVAVSKGEAKITAWSAIGGGTNTVDYRMAVLGVLQMSWLRLHAYAELLRRQVTEDPNVLDPENLGIEPDSLDDASGLIGHRYAAAGKDGRIYAASEEVRALVALESAERDRVVKYAKTAHDMGISDRLTSLAEKWGDLVATRITMILEGLALSPEQAKLAPALIQAHLGSIDMGQMPGGGEQS